MARRHRLESEIHGLQAELRRQRMRDEDASGVEARLDRLRNEHYRIRLEIDRTEARRPSPGGGG